MRTCKCERTIEPEESISEPGKWRMICHHCMLTTIDYPTVEEAIEAWDKHKFTPNSLMLQKPLKELDEDGAVNVVKAMYERLIKDYESDVNSIDGTDEPTDRMIDIENVFRKGPYIGYAPGERGVRMLKEEIDRRAIEREKREGDRIRNRMYRARIKARKNQAS